MDTFAGVRSAVVAAIIMALVELAATLYFFQHIDMVTAFSFILVIAFAITTYFTRKSIYIKLQPVFFGVILGLVLVISYFIDKPFLYIMLTKYKDQFPIEYQTQLRNPMVGEFFKLATNYVGWAILLHAALVAYSALRLSNWWWLAIRGIGFYLFLFLGAIMARVQLIYF